MLPLRHEDIIRQQAADKGLDPALIAGVIYTESRFRDQTSHAGAKGLMQLLPSTAHDIARKSGGTASSRATSPTRRSTSPTARSTCATCCSATAATRCSRIAAYNAGEGRVDEWIFDAAPQGRGVRPRAPHPVPGDAPLRPAGARRPRALPRGVPAGARALSDRARDRREPARRDRLGDRAAPGGRRRAGVHAGLERARRRAAVGRGRGLRGRRPRRPPRHRPGGAGRARSGSSTRRSRRSARSTCWSPTTPPPPTRTSSS